MTNPIGAITSFGYDAIKRQVKMIEASGSGVARTTTTNYDSVEQHGQRGQPARHNDELRL